jgi:hypothetical protein
MSSSISTPAQSNTPEPKIVTLIKQMIENDSLIHSVKIVSQWETSFGYKKCNVKLLMMESNIRDKRARGYELTIQLGDHFEVFWFSKLDKNINCCGDLMNALNKVRQRKTLDILNTILAQD